ncbi:partial Conserved virulence factor B, partial [Candidatus Brocadiaceae bacterium]
KQQGNQTYLGTGASNKILLADKKPAHYAVGDKLSVFVYVDSEGHLAATTTLPLIQADEVAYLKVVSVNYYGAFFDWGLPKNLLVPFSEQHHELEVGKSYLVKAFLDKQQRLVATTKLNKLLSDTDEENIFTDGQTVDLIIADKTELGVKAVVNHTHWGVLYSNEIFQPLKKGQKLTGYIKHIRDDLRIDLSLQAQGYGNKVQPLTDTILEKLKANHGSLPLGDKTPPEAIYQAFGVSKKVYKQAIGALYKQRLIIIEEHTIKLA